MNQKTINHLNNRRIKIPGVEYHFDLEILITEENDLCLIVKYQSYHDIRINHIMEYFKNYYSILLFFREYEIDEMETKLVFYQRRGKI